MNTIQKTGYEPQVEEHGKAVEISGSRAVLEALLEEGVDTVF